MQLRRDLPLRTKIVGNGRSFGFKVPKALIDIGYLKKGKEYKVWIEEIDEE